jgi:maltose/moltooligosaccharide transporter
MPPVARRFGASRLHAACLTIMAGGFALFPLAHDTTMPFIAALGIGIGWGSIMGNPYIVLADSIPPERTGVYMGLFNVMICAPMLLNSFTMPWIFGPVLGNSAGGAMLFGAVLMLCAAATMFLVRGGEKGPALAAA